MKALAFIFSLVLLITGVEMVGQNPNAFKNTSFKPTNQVLSTAVRTRFNPANHGFRFVNRMSIELQIAGLNGPRIDGFCSGMVYATLDYYNRGMNIPQQTHMPTTGSTLQQFIANRQFQCWSGTLDNWTELVVNPFGWRTLEFFNWGLQTGAGQLQNLKASIDAGKPVPLGLFKAGSGGAGPHHCVLAIGYDMGRYKGDLGQYKEDLKIFIYDPNFPNQTQTLRPYPATNSFAYVEHPSQSWMTYFVDKDYVMANPPLIQTVALPDDGMVRKFLLEICTGSDDLRGGNDNLNLIVTYTDGSTDLYPNINKGNRWINNSTETVELMLRRSAPLRNIRSVTLKTTFGGGFGGDNWNLDWFTVTAMEGNRECQVFFQAGNPLVRFDGNNRPFVATFSH